METFSAETSNQVFIDAKPEPKFDARYGLPQISLLISDYFFSGMQKV